MTRDAIKLTTVEAIRAEPADGQEGTGKRLGVVWILVRGLYMSVALAPRGSTV